MRVQSLFIRRYLLAKKSHSVVNIITTLSLVSISLPVAAVIVLLSVFNGFGILIESASRKIEPDVVVSLSRGHLFEVDSIDYRAIEALEGVEALSFVAEQSVLLKHSGKQSVATIRGVDTLFGAVVPMAENISRGEYRTQLGELDRIMVSRAMGFRLDINNHIDKFIELYSLRSGNNFSTLLPMANFNHRSFKLSGIFTADANSEERYAITSLRAVQKILNAEGHASALFIKVGEGHSEHQVIEAIKEVVGSDFAVKSRYEQNPVLFDIVKYEKWALLLISTLIMVLASFSLIGALSMLIIEKRDNIATLRAMGGSWLFIRSIFFGEGVAISCASAALGVVIGSVVTLLQQWLGLGKIPSQMAMIDYPVQLLLSDVVVVVALALSIAISLSWIVVQKMIKTK